MVLVSGPPASGKTTIARPLAHALGFALLTKDDIKESFFSSLGTLPGYGSGNSSDSRRLSDAAIEVLWALAPHCPKVILEANFRTGDPLQRKRAAALRGTVVEVHCRLPLREASRRFAERARTERHHPAHVLREMPAERMAEYAEPFGIFPVLEVDTSQPVDIAALAARVLEALGKVRWGEASPKADLE
jgi:glucokinase